MFYVYEVHDVKEYTGCGNFSTVRNKATIQNTEYIEKGYITQEKSGGEKRRSIDVLHYLSVEGRKRFMFRNSPDGPSSNLPIL